MLPANTRPIERAVNIRLELMYQIMPFALEIYGIHLNHQRYVLSILPTIGLKAHFTTFDIPIELIFGIRFTSLRIMPMI